MEQLLMQYNQARDYLISILPARIEIFLMGMFNPISNYVLIKETSDILQRELIELFPTMPSKDLPSFKFRIREDIREVEVGVQFYYNTQNGLTYLGSTDLGTEVFDLYIRDSYDPRMNYRLIARHGSNGEDYISGSKTAEAEYYLGQTTPLACAYSLALEDGFIG